MTEAGQLLRDYSDNGSETAFRELVARYINLVYSVAVRRAGDDPQLAEDIVQTVFTDLARKARTLRHESMLGGWLHRHACFVSSTMLRGERRRQERERQAMEINTLLNSGDSPWEEIAPVLDQAINELDEADRRAVLLRFFEQRDLRTIGAALGTSEDAAQKRVRRALDKLRTLLARRGVTLSVAALSAVFGSRAVSSAPADLAGRVSNAALAGASVGFIALLLNLMTPARIAITLGVAAVAVVLTPLASYHHTSNRNRETRAVLSEGAVRRGIGAEAQLADQSQFSSTMNAAAADVSSASGKLRLTIVAADSGKPVPNVNLEYWLSENGKFARKEPLQSTRLGVCEVPTPRDTTELLLVSRSEGFADTRLVWRPDRGEKIPRQYTLRLARAVPIGGRVVDADGNLVAGAHVSFGNRPDVAAETRPESRNFGWPSHIETVTGADGSWRMDRIAEEAINSITGAAKHPEHVRADVDVAQNPEAAKELAALTYTFELGRAVTARGSVVDPEGQPVSNAEVLVGFRDEAFSRKGVSGPDGAFGVVGCKPGKNLLTAEAEGFTAATIAVELSDNSGPFQVQLQRGKTLRLRVVNKNNEPIPNAGVWLDTINVAFDFDKPQPKPVQVQFNRKTGADGRLIWEGAPDADLVFAISASGYMHVDRAKAHPDGEEHVITLPPAMTIAGTVRDELTGELIPKFRIITGWPDKQYVNGVMTNVAHWSTIDRFWMNFSGGEYRHTFEEPVLAGVPDPTYIFKFEAEGYAPFVSRTVRPDEGEARLDVTLRKAESSTITVLLSDGSPAARADVGLVWPGARLELVPGGFSRNRLQDLTALLKADADGRFSLAPNDAIMRVIVAHAKGFGETTPIALSADSNIRLQPWGRLEGTYLSGGKPAGGRSLALEYGGGDWATISSGSGFKAQSETHGHFVFPQAPPGRHKLMRVITMSSFSTHELMTEVEIRPGETTTVTLGASNCAVTVRLRWPEELKRQAHWHIFTSLHTSLPQPPAEVANNPQALAGWRHTPEFRALAAQARHYPLLEDAAGLWTAEDVAPGDYALTVKVIDPSTAGGTGSNRAHGGATVTVPANASSQTLDLGEIVLQSGQ